MGHMRLFRLSCYRMPRLLYAPGTAVCPGTAVFPGTAVCPRYCCMPPVLLYAPGTAVCPGTGVLGGWGCVGGGWGGGRWLTNSNVMMGPGECYKK
jgi:hypothetical protein